MPRHPFEPAVSFDGGNLDCGSGLLLLIRRHIDPLRPGEMLEVLSSEASVCEDLPAWCRLTGNRLVSQIELPGRHSFLVAKAGEPDAGAAAAPRRPLESRVTGPAAPESNASAQLAGAAWPPIAPAPAIRPLAVMGLGSWPRPAWMLRALREHLEGRSPEGEFEESARDATRLAVMAQVRAGVDLVTDGEQRRDNYASFVGGLLDNCQLIPVTDLLPYVDDPEEFAGELKALDVPAERVRHPAVFGRLGRSRPLAVQELECAKAVSPLPVKVALPGPYLLTRTMWMECISDRAYPHREALAEDVVRVLREEIHSLLAAGAALVQLDEPVLSEVVFGGRTQNRTFMCGALGSRRETGEELAFARELVNAVAAGFPAARLAMHICRGNWTPDESAALAGDYTPLLPVLQAVDVGTVFLEMCTARAGEPAALRSLPGHLRVGVGVVNQKVPRVETVEEIVASAERAVAVFGAERLLLTPDCGFATFAENPVASAEIAEGKLAAIVKAADEIRRRHRVSG